MAAKRVAVSIACLLGLTGCTSADGGSGGTGDLQSPIKSLSGDELCRMLPLKLVERQFDDVEFRRPEGRVDGRLPNPSPSCYYGGVGLGLTTRVDTTLRPLGVQGNLDLAFTEVDADLNEEVLEYERVDGLGAAAGYGPVPLGMASNHLVVIFEVRHGHYELKLTASAELEQLKPLAEALVPRAQSALS